MKIKKIKVGFKKSSNKNELSIDNFMDIKITYEKTSKQSEDEITSKSGDMPLQSFFNIWNGLRVWVNHICEIDDSSDTVKLTGVSLSWGGENETMGCVLTAQKDLEFSSAPLNLNTPHKIEDFYSQNGGDENQLMDRKMVKQVEELIEETLKYLRGDRAQQKMEGF